MMNFPAIISEKLPTMADTALRIEPTAIRNTKIVAHMRGPHLSVRIPLGICISV